MVIDLLLLTSDAEQVILHGGELGRSSCLKLELDGKIVRALPGDRSGLSDLIVRLVKEQFFIDVRKVAFLNLSDTSENAEFVAAAEVVTPLADLPSTPRLRPWPTTELVVPRREFSHRTTLISAATRMIAEKNAADIGQKIDHAFDLSLDFLQQHTAEESGMSGWSQFLDLDTVGVLSTANGILAQLYGDRRPGLLDRQLDTLRKLQNPDGGWHVKGSLLGSSSNVSITESTATCLQVFHGLGKDMAANREVADGITWLENRQRDDGGWPSSPADKGSFVYPTALAVDVLARYGRSAAVGKGVSWLRAAQTASGGWGATTSTVAVSPSPAYTAAAILALLHAGAPVSDKKVVAGCEYLHGAFDETRPEPWESTSFTSLVDPTTHARLEFRHFGTPWALAALCEAGHDLSDAVVLTATVRLLKLQTGSGGWRSGMTSPDVTPIWALHDCLYAMRSVLDASGGNLEPVIVSRHHQAERMLLGELSGRLLVQTARQSYRRRRNWLTTVWLSVLTVGIAWLALRQLGVLGQLTSHSGVTTKVIAGIATLLVTVLGASMPTILIEEHRIWRGKRDG